MKSIFSKIFQRSLNSELDFNDNVLTINKAIEQGELPRFIYKYYTNEHNRLIDVIEKKSVWFSKPMDFNDPFDCKLKVNTNNSKKEIIRFANSLCDKLYVYDDRRRIVVLNFLNPEYRFEIANKSISDAIQKSGVSCFSKCNDNILMWSHYANSHKGFCVKFDILKDPDFFMIPIILKYHTEYPQFNHIRNYEKVFNNSFGHKYSDWSYEKEIRIVRKEQGNVKINKEAIIEIMFGINCKNEDINTIKKICRIHKFNHISYKRAIRKEFNFGIEFTNG